MWDCHATRNHLSITPPKHFPNLTLWEAPPLGGTGFFWRVFWSGVFWRIFGHFFQSEQKNPGERSLPLYLSPQFRRIELQYLSIIKYHGRLYKSSNNPMKELPCLQTISETPLATSSPRRDKIYFLRLPREQNGEGS